MLQESVMAHFLRVIEEFLALAKVPGEKLTPSRRNACRAIDPTWQLHARARV